MRSALLVAVFALFAVPARAQSTDLRWEPWIGCWTLATENLRSGETQEGQPLRPSTRPSTVRDGAPRVCVSSAANGARFVTTVGNQAAIDQTVIADAASHPVDDTECSGTQRAEWSRNGLRLFSSAEIRCTGDEGLRRVSGLSLVAPNGDWLDIQTVAIGPRETIRVKRYYRADDSPRSTRPTVVSSRLTLDEVKEASGKVSSAALEATLVETNAGFDLSKKALTDLASAGVSSRIIDLMVALSYPEKFAIQRVGQAGGASAPATYVRDPFGFGSPFYYDPFYYSSGYGSAYLYEPFGYRGYVFVDGGGTGGGSVGPTPGVGRVINGQGYTRIVPRDTLPSTNTQTARTASSSTSGSSPSDSGSSSSSSSGSSSSSSGSSGGGGATVSPSGASSGGSSDSGRTAVPR
jgi:hypothetical protein